jgi:hypothetical protein
MTSSAPRHVLVGSISLVGVSTAVLPSVTGYGTGLFQIVVLGAWSIVAHLSSGRFADQHQGPVWFVALLLNVVLFLVPALVVYLPGRKRLPMLTMIVLVSWLGFYLASLFFLFPATDGP